LVWDFCNAVLGRWKLFKIFFNKKWKKFAQTWIYYKFALLDVSIKMVYGVLVTQLFWCSGSSPRSSPKQLRGFFLYLLKCVWSKVIEFFSFSQLNFKKVITGFPAWFTKFAYASCEKMPNLFCRGVHIQLIGIDWILAVLKFLVLCLYRCKYGYQF
jgi:hypothetical protein